MGFYPTDVDEEYNQIMLETEVSGAITKSALEFTPNPQRALLEGIDLLGKVAQAVATRAGNALDGTGMAFEVSFAVRIDGNGVPMLAKTLDLGQLRCKLAYKE